MLGRTQHSVFYDEFHDEIVIPQPFAGAILTFPGGANGETPPIRIIQGPKTGLALNDVMTVDPKHDEYFVPRGQGGGMIHVFDRLAQGDVAPKRIIGGEKAGLGGIPAVDYEHNLLLAEGRDGIYIYDRTAEGDIEPLRKITGGPKSGVKAIAGPVWIPGTRNFVATARAWTAKEKQPEEPLNFQLVEDAQSMIVVFTIDDEGDVEPRYTTGHNHFKEIRNLAIDPKYKTVMAADKSQNDITTWDFKEAWQTFAPAKAPPYTEPRRRSQESPRQGDAI